MPIALRGIATLGLALLCAWPLEAASGAALDILNSIRSQGCGGNAGVAQPFRRDVELDRVALELARGLSLREAIAHVGYKARHSISIVMRHAASEESVRRVLRDQFCSDLLDEKLRLAGIAARDADTWIVLAAPFVPPSKAEITATTQRLLELINEARSHKRRCGSKVYRAAAPLKLAPALNRAALRHARDMARHSFMGHQGHDGSMPAERATRAGYPWRVVGENVAAGSGTAEQAVADWLNSPGHCANLMNREFTETGIAFVVDPASTAGIYWAQVFAAPR